jgi:hypothetical protein
MLQRDFVERRTQIVTVTVEAANEIDALKRAEALLDQETKLVHNQLPGELPWHDFNFETSSDQEDVNASTLVEVVEPQQQLVNQAFQKQMRHMTRGG